MCSLLLIALCAGCFDPSLDALQCSEDGPCPPGQDCSEDECSTDLPQTKIDDPPDDGPDEPVGPKDPCDLPAGESLCLASALFDDFEDNDLSPKWQVVGTALGTAVETGGELVLRLPAGIPADTSFDVVSTAKYNALGNGLLVEVVGVPGAEAIGFVDFAQNGSAQVFMGFTGDRMHPGVLDNSVISVGTNPLPRYRRMQVPAETESLFSYSDDARVFDGSLGINGEVLQVTSVQVRLRLYTLVETTAPIEFRLASIGLPAI